MAGKKNIWGAPTNTNTDIWAYENTKSSEDILSPIDGEYKIGNDNETGIFTYSNKGCSFVIEISPIDGKNFGSVVEGKSIGKAKNKSITLKVKKGSELINPNDFFSEKDDCFKTKKEENKKENTKREEDPYYNKSKKSNQIASSDDFDFIYKNAAFPFKIFSLKTGIKEEVERIKQLMK